PSTLDSARAGIRDLSFADVAVHISNRHLQRISSGTASAAFDLHAIRRDLLHPDLGEVSHHIWRYVSMRVVKLVHQLLLASARRNFAAGAGNLGHDKAAIRLYV